MTTLSLGLAFVCIHIMMCLKGNLSPDCEEIESDTNNCGHYKRKIFINALPYFCLCLIQYDLSATDTWCESCSCKSDVIIWPLNRTISGLLSTCFQLKKKKKKKKTN